MFKVNAKNEVIINNNMDEDPNALLNLIKQTYKIFDFEPAKAKQYDMDEDVVDLFRDLHSKFVFKGFQKMPKGMTGLDSG